MTAATLPLPPTPPQLHVSAGVATLVLNRPAQRNRLENQDLQDLLNAFDQIDADPAIRVMVLTANTGGQPQPVFCAGYDLTGFETDALSATAFEAVPERLAAMRPVTIGALNGSVYGGATDLMLACDLRLGLHGIEWRMPATALGLHFYASGLKRYVSRFGLLATQRAFLTGRPFSSDRLEALGLFEAFCSAESWDDTLGALVRDVLDLSPQAVQDTKRSIQDIATGKEVEATLRERERRSALSDDFAEGRAAFAERRKPVFKIGAP